MMIPFLLLSSILISCSESYKIGIFTPGLSNSQIMFNKRVAEVLANANHDVTMIIMNYLEGFDMKDVKISDNIKVKELNVSSGIHKEIVEKQQAELMFEDAGLLDSKARKAWANMTVMFHTSCEKLANDEHFLIWLKAEKFDVVFSHMYNTCPLGVIYLADLPWIWLNSGALMDYVATSVGVPTIPSYVPPMLMASMDTMTFYERIKSFIGHGLMAFLWPRMFANPVSEIFKKKYGDDFPDLIEFASKCPLVMVNSNELYEFPRPTLSKVINIGGIGMDVKSAKPLNELSIFIDYWNYFEYSAIANKGKGVIIFSFGSVAPSHKMPQEWKESFIKAFARFPDYQFIWKYTGNDLDGKTSENVHLSKWLPQSDLLQHKNTKAFITHGGYNSLQETISAGIPLISIPLFGDQPKNAKLAEAHGFSVSILKTNVSADSIYDAIHQVITHESYTIKAARLSSMTRSRPISAEQFLIRWTEFVAEFKTLENMAPAGLKLNFFQYFSLDVISFLLFLISFTIFVIYKLVAFILKKLCCSNKQIKQKAA